MTDTELEEKATETAQEIISKVSVLERLSLNADQASALTDEIKHYLLESANVSAEAMRDECLKLICRYQSLHPEWVSELIGKVAYLEPNSTAWLQRHDAMVGFETLINALCDSNVLARGRIENGKFVLEKVIADRISIESLNPKLAALTQAAELK